jgi:hypothetical protein
MDDMRGIHAAFLDTRKQQKKQIKTAGIVGVSIKRVSGDHIPGVLGKTTYSSHSCSALLTTA